MKLRLGLFIATAVLGVTLASAGLAQPPVKEPLVSELMAFLPQDVGGAGLFLLTGHVSEILDTATDTITVSESRGRRSDVCEALS